jgi:hypothetical protein
VAAVAAQQRLKLWLGVDPRVSVVEAGIETEKDNRGGRRPNKWFGQNRALYQVIVTSSGLRIVCPDNL